MLVLQIGTQPAQSLPQAQQDVAAVDDVAHDVVEKHLGIHPAPRIHIVEIVAGMRQEPAAAGLQFVDAGDHEAAGGVAIAVVHEAEGPTPVFEPEGMVAQSEAGSVARVAEHDRGPVAPAADGSQRFVQNVRRLVRFPGIRIQIVSRVIDGAEVVQTRHPFVPHIARRQTAGLVGIGHHAVAVGVSARRGIVHHESEIVPGIVIGPKFGGRPGGGKIGEDVAPHTDEGAHGAG